jgi:hypothetical protein
MEQLHTVLEWAKANPWIDRLCILTSHKLPGSLKLLLLDSPPHDSDGEVEKAPKVPDEASDDGEDEGEEDDDEKKGDDKDEPAVVVDTEGEPDEPDEDGAEEDEEGSDSDGKPE